MTAGGVFKNTRIVGLDEMCRSYDFKDTLFARPTALAISDEGIFLAGFANGSIAYSLSRLP